MVWWEGEERGKGKEGQENIARERQRCALTQPGGHTDNIPVGPPAS